MDNALLILLMGRLPITKGVNEVHFRSIVKKCLEGDAPPIFFTVFTLDEGRKVGRQINVRILFSAPSGASLPDTQGYRCYQGNLSILDDNGIALQTRAYVYCPYVGIGYIEEAGAQYQYSNPSFKEPEDFWLM